MRHRIFVIPFAFLMSLWALYWLLGELVVLLEMLSTGAQSRAELADDLGLGLLEFFVVVPGSILGAAACSAIVWRKLGRRANVQAADKPCGVG